MGFTKHDYTAGLSSCAKEHNRVGKHTQTHRNTRTHTTGLMFHLHEISSTFKIEKHACCCASVFIVNFHLKITLIYSKLLLL